MGITGIPPLSLFGHELYSPAAVYWLCLAVVVALALLQTRLLQFASRPHLARHRDDEVAARSYGIGLDRYKGLAFAFGGFAAGVSGAITAHLYSYINYQTFNSQISMLALTMVILGGMGNIPARLSARSRWSACRRCSASPRSIAC